MKELQNLMDDISSWSDYTFGDEQRTKYILQHLQKEVVELIVTPLVNIQVKAEKHLQKEVVELIVAVELANSLKPRNEKITDEFANCFMLLLDAAAHYNITANELIEAATTKLEVNKKHKCGKPDAPGVVEPGS